MQQHHTCNFAYLISTVTPDLPTSVVSRFVVITDPNNPQATNMTEPQLAAQIDLLNTAFATGISGQASQVAAESGTTHSSHNQHAGWQGGRWMSGSRLWQFKLMGVKYATSSLPMCVGSKAEQGMKSLWRSKLVTEGGTPFDRTLVVYASDITNAACNGAVSGYQALFGFSNTPLELLVWKERHMTYRDGVVLDFKYLHNPHMPVQSGSPAMHGASTGAQLVHETGHWCDDEATLDICT